MPVFESYRTLFPRNLTGNEEAFVHITILSEAYTISQADAFYADIQRIVQEVFLDEGAAFRSLVPLLAVHAVFVASETDSIPLVALDETTTRTPSLRSRAPNTAFGLRRVDGPLRSIEPAEGRRAYARARQVGPRNTSCDITPQVPMLEP